MGYAYHFRSRPFGDLRHIYIILSRSRIGDDKNQIVSPCHGSGHRLHMGVINGIYFITDPQEFVSRFLSGQQGITYSEKVNVFCLFHQPQRFSDRLLAY